MHYYYIRVYIHHFNIKLLAMICHNVLLNRSSRKIFDLDIGIGQLHLTCQQKPVSFYLLIFSVYDLGVVFQVQGSKV